MVQKSAFLVTLPTSLPCVGLQEAQAGFGVYPYSHVRDEVELDHNPLPSYRLQLPLHETPSFGYHPVYTAHRPTLPPHPPPPLHLGQFWNLIVQNKCNFEKSTVSVRLFNSDYNGAKGCTYTGFLLRIERHCIQVRRLLPELLLCNFSPHGSPDL